MRMWKLSVALVFLLVGACVTVNIYFPAAEVRQDAERVVQETYGIEVKTGDPAPAPETKEGSFLDILAPSEAYAQDYVNLNNAATRGAEQKLKGNTDKLAPYFAAGNVGIGNDGFATLRSQDGMDLAAVGNVQRLVQQDKSFKMELYKAKAEAAGTPGEINKVQAIYTDIWKRYAPPGWWVQDANGWRQN